jgi:carbonic anhydrase/acetyltransferase-like protein (isoleucine patch superfamily)
MKCFLLLCFLLPFTAIGQSLSINTDGSTANASALLDVKSTSKGVLIPRMTKVQRNAIGAPAKGLMVFIDDADSVGFHFYNGSSWQWLEVLGTAGWKTKGNSGTYTSVNFIGTTDAMPLRFKQNNQWLGQFNLNNGTYFIGRDAGKRNTAAESTAFGDSTMANNISADGNTAFGFHALKSNIDGEYNTAIGTRALEKNKNSTGFNTAVGSYAMSVNIDGVASTAIGSGALSDDISIGFNTAVGFNSMAFNTTGQANTAIGTNSLYRNETGMFNIAMGNNAMFNSDKANYNAAIGSEALRNDTSGYNTALGTLALQQNRKGYAGVALGYSSLLANTTGVGNTAVGAYSFLKNTTGNYGVAIGDSAGYNNTTASSNIFIGHQAGSTNTTGSNNTIVGSDADVLTNNLSNASAIGANALVNQSNSLVLGSINGVNGATANTYVGIGTNTPQYKLHVVNSDAQSGGWLQGIMIENTASPGANAGEAAISFRNITIPVDYQWNIGLNQNPNLAFNYGNDLTGGNTRMTIDTFGRVGIGLTTPTAVIDVDGTYKLGTNGTVNTALIKDTVNIDVGSIAANGEADVTVALANATLNGAVSVSPSADLASGIIIAWARVSAAGTIKIRFRNLTGGAINPAAINYYISVVQ